MNKLINSTTGNNAQMIAQGANTADTTGLGNMVTTNIVSCPTTLGGGHKHADGANVIG